MYHTFFLHGEIWYFPVADPDLEVTGGGGGAII